MSPDRMTAQSDNGERSELERGLHALQLPIDDQVVWALLGHVALIRKWAAGYNLVSRGDLGALIGRHVLDSLAIHPWVKPGPLLDVGSGAGFPGVPFAIVRPELPVTLLDSSGKRVRFLRNVVRTLDLAQVRVEQQRVEDYVTDTCFSSIVSRAFATLEAFTRSVRHLCASNTRVIAIKGQRPVEEIGRLPAWVTIESVEQYHVPNLHAERHVVIMSISP